MIGNIGWITICLTMLMVKYFVLMLKDAKKYKKNQDDNMNGEESVNYANRC